MTWGVTERTIGQYAPGEEFTDGGVAFLRLDNGTALRQDNVIVPIELASTVDGFNVTEIIDP